MNTEAGISDVAMSSSNIAEERQSHGLAIRPASLSGVRLGLLNNGKPNAGALLEAFGYRLADRVSLSNVSTFEKPEFGDSVDDAMVLRIRELCDVVIAGVGD
ncbi:MAG: hypothetical protein EPN30_06025 [Actinomycetota bacterium]|nr:MAG: hypothetical protein EPN30_06025 [Actinomycetota bacterium]